MLSNTQFFNEFKAENFDLLYINHLQHCPMAVAYQNGVQYVRYSSANSGAILTRAFGIPQIASVTPGKNYVME